MRKTYVGRFAPSPNGELHLGSLFTAAASFLDARAQGGAWRLRIDDVDRARNVAGASLRIIQCLENFGFEWDGPVIYQSQYLPSYCDALQTLRASGDVYPCTCSRRDLRDETRYPGTCRHLHRDEVEIDASGAAALRYRAPEATVSFDDRVQGRFTQNVAHSFGDFLIERKDGIPSYALCVVVDDARDGVTDVVRGADLLERTPRQVVLQRALGIATPTYAHVPALTEPGGSKLSKSRRSVGVGHAPTQILTQVFALLGLAPPASLGAESMPECWNWAKRHWNMRCVPAVAHLALSHAVTAAPDASC